MEQDETESYSMKPLIVIKVRATSILCLLGFGLGIGSVLLYKLCCKLFTPAVTAPSSRPPSQLSTRKRGENIQHDLDTPDSGVLVDGLPASSASTPTSSCDSQAPISRLFEEELLKAEDAEDELEDDELIILTSPTSPVSGLRKRRRRQSSRAGPEHDPKRCSLLSTVSSDQGFVSGSCLPIPGDESQRSEGNHNKTYGTIGESFSEVDPAHFASFSLGYDNHSTPREDDGTQSDGGTPHSVRHMRKLYRRRSDLSKHCTPPDFGTKRHNRQHMMSGKTDTTGATPRLGPLVHSQTADDLLLRRQNHSFCSDTSGGASNASSFRDYLFGGHSIDLGEARSGLQTPDSDVFDIGGRTTTNMDRIQHELLEIQQEMQDMDKEVMKLSRENLSRLEDVLDFHNFDEEPSLRRLSRSRKSSVSRRPPHRRRQRPRCRSGGSSISSVSHMSERSMMSEDQESRGSLGNADFIWDYQSDLAITPSNQFMVRRPVVKSSNVEDNLYGQSMDHVKKYLLQQSMNPNLSNLSSASDAQRHISDLYIDDDLCGMRPASSFNVGSEQRSTATQTERHSSSRRSRSKSLPKTERREPEGEDPRTTEASSVSTTPQDTPTHRASSGVLEKRVLSMSVDKREDHEQRSMFSGDDGTRVHTVHFAVDGDRGDLKHGLEDVQTSCDRCCSLSKEHIARTQRVAQTVNGACCIHEPICIVNHMPLVPVSKHQSCLHSQPVCMGSLQNQPVSNVNHTVCNSHQSLQNSCAVHHQAAHHQQHFHHEPMWPKNCVCSREQCSSQKQVCSIHAHPFIGQKGDCCCNEQVNSSCKQFCPSHKVHQHRSCMSQPLLVGNNPCGTNARFENQNHQNDQSQLCRSNCFTSIQCQSQPERSHCECHKSPVRNHNTCSPVSCENRVCSETTQNVRKNTCSISDTDRINHSPIASAKTEFVHTHSPSTFTNGQLPMSLPMPKSSDDQFQNLFSTPEIQRKADEAPQNNLSWHEEPHNEQQTYSSLSRDISSMECSPCSPVKKPAITDFLTLCHLTDASDDSCLNSPTGVDANYVDNSLVLLANENVFTSNSGSKNVLDSEIDSVKSKFDCSKYGPDAGEWNTAECNIELGTALNTLVESSTNTFPDGIDVKEVNVDHSWKADTAMNSSEVECLSPSSADSINGNLCPHTSGSHCHNPFCDRYQGDDNNELSALNSTNPFIIDGYTGSQQNDNATAGDAPNTLGVGTSASEENVFAAHNFVFPEVKN